jgi:hypothetical protein
MSALISALKISLAMKGNLQGQEGGNLLVASVVGSLVLGHLDDEVDQALQLVVVEAGKGQKGSATYYWISLSFKFLNSCKISSSSSSFSTLQSLLFKSSSTEALLWHR